MANPDALIKALGRQLGHPLTLENGVCALFDSDREVVIIEIPPAGDAVNLHCKLAVQPGIDRHEQLLRLNFDAATMSGCWFALDDRREVRLCTQLPLALLDERTFVQWVQGFVKQGKSVLQSTR
jgi:hypothetical protein